MSRVAHRPTLPPAALAAGLVAVLVACGNGAGDGGDEGAGGYGPAERSDFVEACSASADVSAQACGCFYDRLAAQVPHERFEEIDEQLRDDPSAIPQDIADLAIACSAQPEAPPG
jgi:hypothetical protein